MSSCVWQKKALHSVRIGCSYAMPYDRHILSID